MKPMPIGARVAIRKSSEYYGTHPELNPAEQVGVIIDIEEGGGLDHLVEWEHSDKRNNYSREDLRYWRSVKPEPVKVDQEGIDEAVNKAIAACKKEAQCVTARYAFIYETGEIEVNRNTACHATVMDYAGVKAKSIVRIATCINRERARGDINKDVALTYYDWLLNRSPYAEAFITKDAKDAYLNTRYVVCRTDVSANLLQGALVATRQTWEHQNVPNGMHKLVSLGVEENTAHLLASWVRQSSSDVFVYGPQGGGHFHLDVFIMDKEACQAFIENRPQHITNLYSKGGMCNGVHKLFKGRKGVSGQIKALIEKAGAETAQTNTNPFAAAKRRDDGGQVDAEKLAKYVIENGMFA